MSDSEKYDSDRFDEVDDAGGYSEHNVNKNHEEAAEDYARKNSPATGGGGAGATEVIDKDYANDSFENDPQTPPKRRTDADDGEEAKSGAHSPKETRKAHAEREEDGDEAYADDAFDADGEEADNQKDDNRNDSEQGEVAAHLRPQPPASSPSPSHSPARTASHSQATTSAPPPKPPTKAAKQSTKTQKSSVAEVSAAAVGGGTAANKRTVASLFQAANTMSGGGGAGVGEAGATIRLKPGTFVAKASPSQSAKGTPYPRNVVAVARIRPFTYSELEAAKGGVISKDAAADAAVPLRVRHEQQAAPSAENNKDLTQSLVRIGMPDHGVFNTYTLDGAVWGLDTAKVEGHTEEGIPKYSPITNNEQTQTWAAVGEPLVNSIVYPLGHVEKPNHDPKTKPNDGNSNSSSPNKKGSNAVYGNACVISYGATNSGKSYALFGAIHPPCPPPAPPKALSNNAAAASLANNAADAKSQADAFYFANKNRAKRGSSPTKKRGISPPSSSSSPASGSQLLLTAKQVLPAAELNTVTPTDGLIVRAAEHLLRTLCSSLEFSSSGPTSASASVATELHMACLRLHNERLTDLCDEEDPHETRQITAQLYYPTGSGEGTAVGNTNGDGTVAKGLGGGGDSSAEVAALHYYGLKGVKPTRIRSVADVKEMIVKARQQVQRPPEGYLATDVVNSTKGKPDQKDVVIKAKAAKAKEKEASDPSAAAEKDRKEKETEKSKRFDNSSSAVHGSTIIVVLYLVPTKTTAEKGGINSYAIEETPTATLASSSGIGGMGVLPPRSALQKILFVDLPDSNSVSKGISNTSVNAGKEIAFSGGVGAETPLQISNDKAINTMFLTLGSSLAESVRYGRARFPQHRYMLFGGDGVGSISSSTSTSTSSSAAFGSKVLLDLLGEKVSLPSSTQINMSTVGPTHYRNCLLTRILKEATYGPNTFTAVLGCLSPADSEVSASHNTLRFLQAVKRMPVSTVGWEELEALRLDNVKKDVSNNKRGSKPPKEKENDDDKKKKIEYSSDDSDDSKRTQNNKNTNKKKSVSLDASSALAASVRETSIVGSLTGSSLCVAFDDTVVRKAAEKAKVNPFTMLKLGATLSSGAEAALAPINVRKEENDFFKREAAARNDIAIVFQAELTALQKQDLAERLSISKRANQSEKLREAIARGNAAIGSATFGTVPAPEDLLADDFESQFRVPHKITTSQNAPTANRPHITHRTTSFIREHDKKYNFREESKGAAHVGTNTLGLSNQTYGNIKQLEEEKKRIAAGEVASKHKKTGPPRIPNKKKKEPEPEPEPPAPKPKKPTVAEARSGVGVGVAPLNAQRLARNNQAANQQKGQPSTEATKSNVGGVKKPSPPAAPQPPQNAVGTSKSPNKPKNVAGGVTRSGNSVIPASPPRAEKKGASPRAKEGLPLSTPIVAKPQAETNKGAREPVGSVSQSSRKSSSSSNAYSEAGEQVGGKEDAGSDYERDSFNDHDERRESNVSSTRSLGKEGAAAVVKNDSDHEDKGPSSSDEAEAYANDDGFEEEEL